MTDTFRELFAKFTLQDITHQVVLLNAEGIIDSYPPTNVLVDALMKCDEMNRGSGLTWIVMTTATFTGDGMTKIILTEPNVYNVKELISE